MKKLNVFETFSGIGAQKTALENLSEKGIIDYQSVGISDWDVFSVQAYAAMHHPGYENQPDASRKEIDDFISSQTFSIDGKNPFNILKSGRFKDDVIQNWYKAFKVTNNIGSIVASFNRVSENIIKKKGKIDLLTYSFPCQDLSSAGNFHGFNEGIKEHTRSGLLLEIEYLVTELGRHKLQKGEVVRSNSKDDDNLLPKFLLLENVLNLVQSKHKGDFERWLDKLAKLGYKTIWGKINSHDYGLIQARRRVFAISIYDPKDKIPWDVRDDLQDVLNEIYLSGEFQPKWNQHKDITKVFDFDNKFINESILSAMKNTPSRIKMRNLGAKINKDSTKVATVTTKQDRFPNVGSLKFENNWEDETRDSKEFLGERFITPRESYRLMGFSDQLYKKASKKMNEICVSEVAARDKLLKQAGNSIAVNALEMIFYYISKGDFK